MSHLAIQQIEVPVDQETVDKCPVSHFDKNCSWDGSKLKRERESHSAIPIYVSR